MATKFKILVTQANYAGRVFSRLELVEWSRVRSRNSDTTRAQSLDALLRRPQQPLLEAVVNDPTGIFWG